MFEDLMGGYGMRFLIAALGVGLALVCFVVAMMIIRRRAPSPFVRGGKNRQPRLQVLDAAAVDARRRLVLIRRDDVEHLVMIGGPTDIVIESRIGAEQPIAIEARPQTAAVELPTEPRIAAERTPLPMADPVRVAAPVADYRPQVESAAVAPERIAPSRPAAQQPLPAAPQTPVARPQPQVAPPPPATAPAPVTPTRLASPAPAPQDAVAALDAARQRVLPQQVERPPIQAATSATPSMPTATQSPAAAKPELGSEFDRILEAEMANNLSTGRVVTLNDTASPQNAGVKREPERPVITGAGPSQDPVQKEMARIFGEMSVTRDK